MGFSRWFDKAFSLDLPFNYNCDYSGHIWGDWKYDMGRGYRECRWCGYRKYEK